MLLNIGCVTPIINFSLDEYKEKSILDHWVCVCDIYNKIYKNNMVFKCKYARINILSNISSVTFSNVIDAIMED